MSPAVFAAHCSQRRRDLIHPRERIYPLLGAPRLKLASDLTDEAMPFLHAQQPLGRDGLIGTLDLNKLRLSEATPIRPRLIDGDGDP